MVEHGINDVTQQAALVGLLWQPNDDLRLRVHRAWATHPGLNNANVALDPPRACPFRRFNKRVFVDEPFTENDRSDRGDAGSESWLGDPHVGYGLFEHRTPASEMDATTQLRQAPLLLDCR